MGSRLLLPSSSTLLYSGRRCLCPPQLCKMPLWIPSAACRAWISSCRETLSPTGTSAGELAVVETYRRRKTAAARRSARGALLREGSWRNEVVPFSPGTLPQWFVLSPLNATPAASPPPPETLSLGRLFQALRCPLSLDRTLFSFPPRPTHRQRSASTHYRASSSRRSYKRLRLGRSHCHRQGNSSPMSLIGLP